MTEEKGNVLRGADFNHFYYMDEEELGNTIQVEFTTDTAYPEETIIAPALGDLQDKFKCIDGIFKVTIEFYPDSEAENE